MLGLITVSSYFVADMSLNYFPNVYSQNVKTTVIEVITLLWNRSKSQRKTKEPDNRENIDVDEEIVQITYRSFFLLADDGTFERIVIFACKRV